MVTFWKERSKDVMDDTMSYNECLAFRPGPLGAVKSPSGLSVPHTSSESVVHGLLAWARRALA